MTDRPSVTRIAAILRTVPDLAAAEAFYADALGFAAAAPARPLGTDDIELLGATGSAVTSLTMRLGSQTLAFLCFDPAGQPYPSDSTSSDLWFQHAAIVVADMSAAFARVMSAGAQPISWDGPQQLPPNTGRVRAFKFRDPFGHPLELLWFPPGTGDAAWRSPTNLIEGIDHTAIAVDAAEASTHFYRTMLGLDIGDRTRNRGPAQDRLDALADDNVEVVPLLPHEAPPHLELLGYRVGTRRRLKSTNPADAAVGRTVAVVDDLAALAARLAPAAASRKGRWRGQNAVLFHDPDGHVWICVEA